jgi:exoribonuclease-2
MLKENSVVLYKSSAAVVLSAAENKYKIKFRAVQSSSKKSVYETQGVREKDVILLSENAASSLENVLRFAEEKCPLPQDFCNLNQTNEIFLQIKECYELLAADGDFSSYDFADLVSLFRGNFVPDESFGLFCALKNTVYFCQCQKELSEGKIAFSIRSAEEIDSLVKKAGEKEAEQKKRAEFLERLKSGRFLKEDSVFMGDVESLALGKSDKSRTMHDAGLKETPERAHRLLLETGIWDVTRNPYPFRWGLSTKSASETLPSPPLENRMEVAGTSFAIDNEWSSDPDDAVAFDGKYLWVHIADPSCAVEIDSSIDRSARARGATLYIPEGAARMLCESSLEDYALGLKETSCALSFRLLLGENAEILDCAVFKTLVKVKRLTYEQADSLMESAELKPLFEIARKNMEKRKKSGAVQIDLPEVHITVNADDKKVFIEPLFHPRSSAMVREMMLLAGEGAAKFAFKNEIPFPFVSQDSPSSVENDAGGLAFQFKLRRSMRKRSVGVTPSMHCGLGLNMYSQVTSPLRRYGDLLAHIQLRAFLDGKKLLDRDELLIRLSEGEMGAQASHKAERKSNLHWTMVFLLQNPGWTGEAVCVENSGKIPLFFIPSLAQETFIPCQQNPALNEAKKIRVKKIEISEQVLEFEIIG